MGTVAGSDSLANDTIDGRYLYGYDDNDNLTSKEWKGAFGPTGDWGETYSYDSYSNWLQTESDVDADNYIDEKWIANYDCWRP